MIRTPQIPAIKKTRFANCIIALFITSAPTGNGGATTIRRAIMQFAKRVFLIAGIWGVLIMVPQYFNEGWIGQHLPPAITHPEYYYGFTGGTLAWQLAFLV